MTDKLYDTDPYLRSFTALVLSCEPDKNGFALVLDKTAFYPEGGGQPADRGALDDVRVLDVREKDGLIRHICDRPLEPGISVRGEIDWARRFDHMQQHSGEHIVSGMICKRFGCNNVGFHLGEETVTVDFDVPIAEPFLWEVEEAANAYIWGNTPIDIQLLEGEALARAEYRSKKFIPGKVRLVGFPGADRCACCGTHVSSAGQVGLVKLLSCQTFRGGTRIELLCGKRAMDHLTAVWRENTAVSRRLSAHPRQTGEAVRRMTEEHERLKARIAALEKNEFEAKARQYAGRGDVLLIEGPMSADSVRRLCDAVQSTCGGRCAVFAGENTDYKYAVGQPGGDVRPLVKALNVALNGRGGGKPEFAQGSVSPQDKAAAIRDFFQNN